MKEYDSKDFLTALDKKVKGRPVPQCPFCGGNSFSTTQEYATILLSKDLHAINIGTSVPVGMLVCKNCGHVEFFALGLLGMLDNTEEKTDGK